VSVGAPPAAWPFGLKVALVLGVGATFPYFEEVQNANELPRILQALARIDDGVWSIDEQRRDGVRFGPDTAKGADGHLYPNKPPGTTIAAMVGVGAARMMARWQDEDLTLRDVTWWTRVFGSVVPTYVLATALMRRHARTFGPAAAAAAALMLVLATPLAAYAHVLYGHALAAALLHVGIARLVPAIGEPGLPAVRKYGALVGGLLAGAAVAVEYAAVFAAIPIGIAIVLRMRDREARGPAIAALVGALVPIALLARYHAIAFGSPFATGYHHATQAEFAAKHAQGLLGLSWPTAHGAWTQLLSPDGGLLFWAPTSVLAIAGLVMMVRKGDPRRFEAGVHLGIVLVFLWVNASLSFEGGWRIGPRYFVIALPSLVMGWAAIFGRIRARPVAVACTSALAVYAAVANGLAANLWPHLDLTAVDAPLTEVLVPLFTGELRPYGAFATRPGFDLVAVVVATGVIAVAFALARAIDARGRTLLALAAGALVGLALVQASALLPRNAKAAKNLAYVERVWEPKGDTPAKSVVLDAARER
jgi:hypothetical protein